MKETVTKEEIIDLLGEVEYFKCREVAGKLEAGSREVASMCTEGQEIVAEIDGVKYDLLDIQEAMQQLRRQLTMKELSTNDFNAAQRKLEERHQEL